MYLVQIVLSEQIVFTVQTHSKVKSDFIEEPLFQFTP